MNAARDRLQVVAYALVVFSAAVAVSVATSDYRRSTELNALRVQVLCESIETNRMTLRDAAETLARPTGGLTDRQVDDLEELLAESGVAETTCEEVDDLEDAS